MKHEEYGLQKAVCAYLSMQYPSVLYLSDTVASVQLTKGQAGRNKAIQKSGFKTPDLLILQPNRGFHGLMIELKISSPFRKDGTLLKNAHLEGQWESIQQLRRAGYMADFAVGFDAARNLIDNYMRYV